MKRKTKILIAKRDFIIAQNSYYFAIKRGDDIIKLGIPAKFYENLKTEKII